MKKVLAIMGSPRKGRTYKVVQMFEKELKKYDETEFEYVFLKDMDLQMCRGCSLCLERGEEFCPVKDDRNVIFEKMMNADGVIFATPNYSLQVSALMKNLLDRLAYVFHRPCFFHRTAMPIVIQGAYGDKEIIKYLETVTRFWGFNVCSGVGLTVPTDDLLPSEQEKIDSLIEKSARRFYNTLTGPQDPEPSFKDVMIFRFTRTIKPFITEFMPRDYEYFKERGWLKAPYYYKTKLSLFKKLFGAWIDRQGIKQGENMKKEREKFVNEKVKSKA